MITIIRPVDPDAVVAMLAAGSQLEARIHRVQVLGFPCWGFARPDGLMVAAGGLVPRNGMDSGMVPRDCDDGRLFEAWFCARPEAAPVMLGVLRRAHLTIRRHCEDAPATVQAFVREGWRPGQRIVAALGFGFDQTGGDPILGPVERWVMHPNRMMER